MGRGEDQELLPGRDQERERAVGPRGWLARWCVAFGVVIATTVAPFGATPIDAGNDAPFPDVDITIIARVQDSAAWLTLHQEVLGTPGESSKPLDIALPAGTGGNRSLRIERPKFSVEIITRQGGSLLKVGVTGKIVAAEALTRLTAFQRAALEVQAGAVHNELSMAYGLSHVTGQLLELYLGRP